MKTKATKLEDKDILNLPDAPDFISEEPVIDFYQMFLMCEKILPELNKKRQSDQDSTPEPFVL